MVAREVGARCKPSICFMPSAGCGVRTDPSALNPESRVQQVRGILSGPVSAKVVKRREGSNPELELKPSAQ